MDDDEGDELETLVKPTAKAVAQWVVVCPTVNDTLADGQNRSAVRVCITDGVEVIELCRVGIIRRNTKNKDVLFPDQFQAEVDKANEITDTINDYLQYLEELRAEAAKLTRKRVHEIIGKPSPVPV